MEGSTPRDGTLFPALFVGHGSPMNTLETNRFTEAWRRLGTDIVAAHGRPRAVLAVSAHWYTRGLFVTSGTTPRTIHDFYGFPDELFAVEYPAPGSPELTAEVAGLTGAQPDAGWGLDHGTWSVLAHIFRAADVPVVQLSVDATMSPEEQLEVGRRLAPLRERGVLVLSSGNIVHNLGRIDWHRTEGGLDWAERFDTAVRDVMATRPHAVTEMMSHPDFGLAHPSADHFLPLLHVAGLADAAGATATVPVGGCTMGSLSMTSFLVR